MQFEKKEGRIPRFSSWFRFEPDFCRIQGPVQTPLAHVYSKVHCSHNSFNMAGRITLKFILKGRE